MPENLSTFSIDKFDFASWRANNFKIMKAWTERPGDCDPTWEGRLAGLIFRLREESGYAISYFHGTLVCGNAPVVPEGRKFNDNEFEMRKNFHARLKKARYTDISTIGK